MSKKVKFNIIIDGNPKKNDELIMSGDELLEFQEDLKEVIDNAVKVTKDLFISYEKMLSLVNKTKGITHGNGLI